ncbi:MAG TPA: transposase [Oceanithermus profundus]|uniref:Transposase n=1 Tax=Oceanithermus profundus TaxID=187137 RepID=A0A7C4Z721_9DEIN|nr:transposase [Oceanithermus profundus]
MWVARKSSHKPLSTTTPAMPILSANGPSVPPSFAAGLVLLSLRLLSGHDLPRPTASSVVDALGASRSRAYAARDRLAEELPALVRGPGRPVEEPAEAPDTSAITAETLDFVMRHPGCVHRGEQRTRYAASFRLFALEQTEAHPELDLPALAQAMSIPPGTLRDWQRGGNTAVDLREETNLAEARDPATEPRIAAVVAAFRSWDGDFLPFCEHVQLNLRIPFGVALIRRILEAEGVRIPRRRRGRSPDEEALRGQFETFFPGFQWVGDGTPLAIEIDGITYTFNLELMVDAHTGAVTGLSLREEEDGAAVVEALEDGVATTGAAPKALLLDNRPSNHTEEVAEALGEDTVKVAATPFRPQNKAHAEGAFGLFRQTVPKLRLSRLEPERLARDVLSLVVTTWARTLNHRPRRDRGGKSRAQLYDEAPPTDEQIAEARRALAERVRKQDGARKTRRARLDPDVCALLDEALKRLGLADPERRFRDAIARYPLDAIVAGIAVFEGKRKAGTLPDGVDARYLLGIVRNISDQDEGLAIAQELFDRRVELRDRALARLDQEREELEEQAEDTLHWLRELVTKAVAADRFIDRIFWLGAVADLINEQPETDHRRLFLIAARHIHAHHRIPKKDRNAATRRLAAMIRPIA